MVGALWEEKFGVLDRIHKVDVQVDTELESGSGLTLEFEGGADGENATDFARSELKKRESGKENLTQGSRDLGYQLGRM